MDEETKEKHGDGLLGQFVAALKVGGLEELPGEDAGREGGVMNKQERELILRALDALGLALAAEAHTWTDEERQLYTDAVCIVKTSDEQETA